MFKGFIEVCLFTIFVCNIGLLALLHFCGIEAFVCGINLYILEIVGLLIFGLFWKAPQSQSIFTFKPTI